MRRKNNRIRWAVLAVLLLLPACSAGGEKPPEVTTLIYANLTEGGVSRAAVNRFNRTHKDVQIEVRDYFDEDGVSGQSRLMAEMATGQIPDILDMRKLSYQVLARKGYLEDLWPFIERDPELGRDSLIKPPLAAAEINGGLYIAFGEVYINTLIGAENVVGNRYSWTLGELRETFSTMPEGSTILDYYYTRKDMFYYVFRMALDHYVDWETGQCSFDGEQFRSSLEFVGSFPETFEMEYGEDINSEHTKRILSGRQMLQQWPFGRLFELQFLDTVYGQGGRAAFIGYPTADGSVGSGFYLPAKESRLAMSSTCADKDAAWEFLRQVFLPRYADMKDDKLQERDPKTLPINRKDYERLIRFDMSKQTAAQRKQGLYDGPTIYFRAATEEDLARYEDFIEHIDKIEICDNTIFNLVKEICGPYFAGDKGLDETVDLIQRRVSLYVNESR